MREGDVAEFTQQDPHDVEMQIAASEADVRGALEGRKILSLVEDESGDVRVTVDAPEQSDTDGCIDAVRARGLSIVSIARKKQTLEDAFLSVVDPGRTES